MGVDVRFYRRLPSKFFTIDFGRGEARVQRVSQYTTAEDAAREAAIWIRARADEASGVAGVRRAAEHAARRCSTLEEVREVLFDEHGVKLFEDKTRSTYWFSLVRLARVVNEAEPMRVRLDEVLRRDVVERFYAEGQGLRAVNWVDALYDDDDLPINGGLNTCVRNVRSLFAPNVCRSKFGALKLPDLTEFREVGYLTAPLSIFEPWPNGIYERMVAASDALREAQPELWLVNAMLRRLGLRVSELLAARREWIEVDGAQAWLVIKERTDFKPLKHGSGRRLTLDPELREILLAREGYLIADGWARETRRDLVGREHSQFLRQFIPLRRQTNHELRKYAASLVFRREREAGRDGLAAAAYFLGDTIEITRKVYAAYLGGSAMLDADAVRQV